MGLNLNIPEQNDMQPRITVFGVGGAGGNAVNNMIANNLEGAEFIVANTDAQALAGSKSVKKLQLGANVTEGLGAGARPEIGASAAEESLESIVDHLSGAHMVFVTAGMGGGTGTGAAPIVARAARELGILTVGVVTKPFSFEGTRRMRLAEQGIEELQKYVDTLIVIPNQNLFLLANERTTFTEAFALADDVLHQGVKGVTDLMVRPGLMNLDFADVRSVMNEMGKAMMGTGEASGENRAIHAAEKAIANPLLDEVSLHGARGVLINITGGEDMTLMEFDEAANRIRNEVDPDANIIVGSTLAPELEGVLRVSVVATGIDASEKEVASPSYHGGYTTNTPREVPQAQPERVEVEAPVQQPEPVQATAKVEENTQDIGLFANMEARPEPEVKLEEPAPQYVAPPVAAQPKVVAQEPQPQPAATHRYGQPTEQAKKWLAKALSVNPEERAGAEAARREALSAAPKEPEAPRGNIPSIIGRMASPSQAQQREPVREVQSEPQKSEAERDRIQVPSFLRRQAN